MGGTNPKPTVPKSTVSAATSRTTTSDAMQSRRRTVQNYLVIWVDGFRNLLQKKKEIPDTEINELKRKYHQKSPVWWYTCEMFLYGMLSWGLRSLDMEAMFKLGFFIRSLHLQLKQLHQKQSAKFKKSFAVYRGQGMNEEDFQNLLDSKGGLLSFNNFLST
ncbi:unnamed protein product, partial [Rotaria socialis]